MDNEINGPYLLSIYPAEYTLIKDGLDAKAKLLLTLNKLIIVFPQSLNQNLMLWQYVSRKGWP